MKKIASFFNFFSKIKNQREGFNLAQYRIHHNRTSFPVICQFLKGEGVTNNVLGERFPSFFGWHDGQNHLPLQLKASP